MAGPLARALRARVTGYALAPPTEPSNFVASGVRERLAGHHQADVRDAAALRKALQDAAPDVVFHLAAQPLVREGYAQPRETFETNIMGTINLLEAIRTLAKPCVVVVVTSDKCYENREHPWGYRECDAMGGHDPYSASKGAAELVTAAYRRSFFPPQRLGQHGVKVATARAGNVIGGGDWAQDRIVTDLVRHLAAGQPVPVRSPRRRATLAACAGTAGRLSDAGRANAGIQRPCLVRRLELWPLARRRFSRPAAGGTFHRGLGRRRVGRSEQSAPTARGEPPAAVHRQVDPPARLASPLAGVRGHPGHGRLVSAVLPGAF